MNPEIVVALVAGLAGTAGLAGVVKVIDGARRPSRMRAQIIAELELGDRFPEGDPAREALHLSARSRAIDLATLTLVRVGSLSRFLRMSGTLLLVAGLSLVASTSYVSWRESKLSLEDYLILDDPEVVWQFWVGILFALLGWLAIVSTLSFLYLYRPRAATIIHVEGVNGLPVGLIPLELEPFGPERGVAPLIAKARRLGRDAGWSSTNGGSQSGGDASSSVVE